MVQSRVTDMRPALVSRSVHLARRILHHKTGFLWCSHRTSLASAFHWAVWLKPASRLIGQPCGV